MSDVAVCGTLYGMAKVVDLEITLGIPHGIYVIGRQRLDLYAFDPMTTLPKQLQFFLAAIMQWTAQSSPNYQN